MKLIEFCPGDGSRFIVAAALLEPSDARVVGGSDSVLMVVFGPEGRMRVHPFQCDPSRWDTLALSYIEEKFPGMPEDTLAAAHHAVAFLLGRNAFGANLSTSELGWDPEWRERLSPLTAAIREAFAERERAGFGDRLLAAYDAVHCPGGPNAQDTPSYSNPAQERPL